MIYQIKGCCSIPLAENLQRLHGKSVCDLSV